MPIHVPDSCLLSKVCPLVHGPCVLFPHRREGRSPPSLETACKWIMRMPLIYRQSQSAAAHLESAFSDGVKLKNTPVAEVFGFKIM